MAQEYALKIITPQGVAYEGSVSHALVPAETGFVGVLANHAPYLVSSAGGTIVIKEKSGSEKRAQVGSGFFEVAHNKAVFLTQSFLPKN